MSELPKNTMMVISTAKLPMAAKAALISRIRRGLRYRGRRPVIKAIDFYALQQRVRQLEQAAKAGK